MGIKQICDTITNFFNNARTPFPQLNAMLLACSLRKRPGLSTIQSTANVVKGVNKLGIPTGQMPNGMSNLTVGVAYAIVDEVFRALREDASVQGAAAPATANVVVAGPSGTMTGTIVNALKSYINIG